MQLAHCPHASGMGERSGGKNEREICGLILRQLNRTEREGGMKIITKESECTKQVMRNAVAHHCWLMPTQSPASFPPILYADHYVIWQEYPLCKLRSAVLAVSLPGFLCPPSASLLAGWDEEQKRL